MHFSKNSKEELEPGTTGIRKLCPTRWTVRGESLKSILENYNNMLQDFFEVAYDEMKDFETRARITGISVQMSTFISLLWLNCKSHENPPLKCMVLHDK